MTANILFEGSRGFDAEIQQIQDEIAEKVKSSARNKAGKVASHLLEQEALTFVEAGVAEFANKLRNRYTTRPWKSLAEILIIGLRDSYFRSNQGLLRDVEQILSGQEEK